MDSHDPIEELIRAATPERLLLAPQAHGGGVAVAVIDSGIEQDVLAERARQRGETLLPIQGAIFRDNQPPQPYHGHHSSPHGTAVADIILRLAPRVQLYSADVFGPVGTCSVETMLAAIRYALDVWKVQIINLSLGIAEPKLQPLARRWQLQQLIEEAYYRDVVVVAAAHNDHPFTRSYPAAFAPPLLSVDKGLFDNPLTVVYHLNEQIEFMAHGRGYLGPYVAEPATSWAAPHVSGVAARLLSVHPHLKPFEIKTLLYWLSRRSGGQ